MVASSPCDIHISNSDDSIEFELSNDDMQDLSIRERSLLDIVSRASLSVTPDKERTLNPDEQLNEDKDDNGSLPISSPHAYPCKYTDEILPFSPTKWPQSPLLLKPAPFTSTRIRGVRYTSSKEYITIPGMCLGCTLPINTGNEPPGQSLVIDFETDLFVGTVLFRIQGCRSPSPESSDDKNKETSSSSYFANRKRSFQAVVRGRFRSPDISMSDCITGQLFHRPPGHLPPTWMLKAGIRLISHLAPQLDAHLDKKGSSHFFSPLVSTAQVVMMDPLEDSCAPDADDLETDEKLKLYKYYPGSNEFIENGDMMEPDMNHPKSVLTSLEASAPEILTSVASYTNNLKRRKKAFDALYKKKISEPKFDVNKEYTFEFYSHLLSLEDMTLDMGKALGGKYSLKEMLNGQPIKFMAGRKDKGKEQPDWLWSFDIWNDCLYESTRGH